MGQTYKVTGNNSATHIDIPDSELDGNGGTEDDSSEINYVWINNIAIMTKFDGIDDLLDSYVMHACIQSDPGEPKTWKDSLSDEERKWWPKDIRDEFNNFLTCPIVGSDSQ